MVSSFNLDICKNVNLNCVQLDIIGSWMLVRFNACFLYCSVIYIMLVCNTSLKILTPYDLYEQCATSFFFELFCFMYVSFRFYLFWWKLLERLRFIDEAKSARKLNSFLFLRLVIDIILVLVQFNSILKLKNIFPFFYLLQVLFI